MDEQVEVNLKWRLANIAIAIALPKSCNAAIASQMHRWFYPLPITHYPLPMTTLKSVGIRIEGTAEQLQETKRRLSHVIDLSDGKAYPSRQSPDVTLIYYRGYFYEKDTLLDQLEAAIADRHNLEQQMQVMRLENDELKRQLGLVPQPGPCDAVLSPKHRQPSC